MLQGRIVENCDCYRTLGLSVEQSDSTFRPQRLLVPRHKCYIQINHLILFVGYIPTVSLSIPYTDGFLFREYLCGTLVRKSTLYVTIL
jgi:hypothetical protein